MIIAVFISSIITIYLDWHEHFCLVLNLFTLSLFGDLEFENPDGVNSTAAALNLKDFDADVVAVVTDADSEAESDVFGVLMGNCEG